MLLEIENHKEVHDFLNNARKNDHDVFSTKGQPPEGAQYSDGELIKNKVNVKWVNFITGHSVDIEYKKG